MKTRCHVLIIIAATAALWLPCSAQSKALIGQVISVSGSSVVITIGSNQGVQADMTFIVQRALTVLRDPNTGAVIRTLYENIAEIKAVDIKERSTACRLISKLSSSYEVAIRDRVIKKS